MRTLRLLVLIPLLGVNALAAAEILHRFAPPPPFAAAPDAATHPRAVVVGLDGIDVRWLRRYLEQDAARPPAERKLANFARLRELGGLHPLRSEIPPESPVAWASVLTGVNPARHRIFDFVQPGAGYRPVNGMVAVRRMRLVGGRVPLRPPMVRSRLAAPTFLERVRAAGYPVLALRQPMLFPAPQVSGAHLLAGLGTPDLAGGAGFYAVWSSRPSFPSGDTIFGGVRIPLDPDQTDRWETTLPGPVDPTLPRHANGAFARARAPLVFEVVERGGRPALAVEVAGRREVADRGERTPFMVVPFDLGTVPTIRLRGHVRFEVKSITPLVVLADPVNLYAPDTPMPVTTPASWARELWATYGPFETVGWTEQTFAMNDRHQDDEGFLRDMEEDMDRGAGMLLGEIDKGARCVFQLFTATDRAKHCFYRYYDPEHPEYVPGRLEAWCDPVLVLFEKADRILGQVLDRLNEDELLLVCSDHGFASFRWGVNLNRWLVEEGYLVLQKDVVEQNLARFMLEGDVGADAVDWSRTRAYAMGLGQIYLNRIGREEQGIVADADADGLAEEIAGKLLALENPYRTDEQPILAVYRLHDLYAGPGLDEAAELQVGFGDGYRVSWQTALLGGMGKPVFEPNDRPWSGDHCSNDVTTVPGILLANHPIPPAPEDDPYMVRDVAATVLDWFGLDASELDAESVPLRAPRPSPGAPGR